MKIIYFKLFLILLIPFCFSCKKNALSGDGGSLKPSVLSLQIQDQQPIIATDTGYFPVLASNIKSPITKFSVEHMSDFEGFLDKVIVELPNGVTIDNNGNFSEPVTTALIRYPVKATTTAGDILTVKFTFTDVNGNSLSTTASKIVVNYRSNGTKEFLYGSRPWYNFITGKSYSKSSITDTAVNENLEVFWVRKDGIQYLCSPNSNKTAAEFTGNPDYDQSEMHETKFIKLEGSLDDVGDDTFKNMDFTNAVDVIVLEDKGLYGLLLQNGKKAVMATEIYANVYSRVTSKYQISP